MKIIYFLILLLLLIIKIKCSKKHHLRKNTEGDLTGSIL